MLHLIYHDDYYIILNDTTYETIGWCRSVAGLLTTPYQGNWGSIEERNGKSFEQILQLNAITPRVLLCSFDKLEDLYELYPEYFI